VLWGGGLPADEVAAAGGIICHELFCALARRVPVVDIVAADEFSRNNTTIGYEK
jgi:hypothetical protein